MQTRGDGGVDTIIAVRRIGETNTRKQTSRIFGGVESSDDPAAQGGTTPLMRAAENGHAETARLLMENGADVGAMNKA